MKTFLALIAAFGIMGWLYYQALMMLLAPVLNVFAQINAGLPVH